MVYKIITLLVIFALLLTSWGAYEKGETHVAGVGILVVAMMVAAILMFE